MYAGAINLWRVGLSRQQAHAKCAKGENMDDEKEFYRREIIRYVGKCDNTDWLYAAYYLLKKLLE